MPNSCKLTFKLSSVCLWKIILCNIANSGQDKQVGILQVQFLLFK